MTVANSINSIFSNSDAFGNLAVSQLSPILQIQFPYLINPDITRSTVTGSGTVTQAAPFGIVSTTAAINSSAKIETVDNLHYKNGQGVLVLFTAVYTAGVVGSVQESGVGDVTDGFFFGFVGATFGITRRTGAVDTFIPQSTWNKDKMDGTGTSGITLIPTFGNVYKIQYQWLGFGNIFFYIESAISGKFVLVHVIQYPNQAITTSLQNPSIPLSFRVANTTNNTNIVLKVPSMAGFIEGSSQDTGLIYSINNSKSVTTLVNLLTILCKTTFGGVPNKKFVNPRFLSISCTGASDVTFSLFLNPTIGGAPVFTDIGATSVISYDVAGTTITGGRRLMTFTVNNDTNQQIDTTTFPFILNPGDRLCVGAISLGAAVACQTALTWTEQF